MVGAEALGHLSARLMLNSDALADIPPPHETGAASPNKTRVCRYFVRSGMPFPGGDVGISPEYFHWPSHALLAYADRDGLHAPRII